MEALGQKLKQIRLEQGIELSEVQEQTKIRVRYLQAIENGNWSELPGPVYAKGFIRSYAEFLGLESQVLLAEYGQLGSEPAPPIPGASIHTVPSVDSTQTGADRQVRQQARSVRTTASRKRKPSMERSMWPQFAVGVGILACLVFGYAYFSKGASHSGDTSTAHAKDPGQASVSNTSQPLPDKPTSSPAPVVQAPAPPPKPSITVKPVQTTSDSSVFSVSNTDHLTIQMTTPKGDCWVSVTSDGKNIYSGLLKQGTSQSWNATNKIQIQAGNSSAIELKVNDQSAPTVDFQGVHWYTYQLQ